MSRHKKRALLGTARLALGLVVVLSLIFYFLDVNDTSWFGGISIRRDFLSFALLFLGMALPSFSLFAASLVYSAIIDRLSPIRLADLPEGLRQDEPWRNDPNPPFCIKHTKEQLADLEAQLFDIYAEGLRIERAEHRPSAYWKAAHRLTRRLLATWCIPGTIDDAKERAEALRDQLGRFYNGHPNELISDLQVQLDRFDVEISKKGERNRYLQACGSVWSFIDAVTFGFPAPPTVEELKRKRTKLQGYVTEATRYATQQQTAAAAAAQGSPLDRDAEQARRIIELEHDVKSFDLTKQMEKRFEHVQEGQKFLQRAADVLNAGHISRSRYESLCREIKQKFGLDEDDSPFVR
jgi:hypothetical protein